MTKELLTIEFRYLDAPKGEYDGVHRNKTVTIGVFDTLEDAIKEGNIMLDTLSKKFEVRTEDKFQIKYLFGNPKRLVTNTCYPTKGIEYFAQITSLKFEDLSQTVEMVFKSTENYREYKKSLI